MPVDDRHLQPPGLLHGGMSVALAKSVAAAGAWLNCPPGKVALGSSVNASYIRSKGVGSRLWAVGIPEFVGPDKQLWEVDVRDEAGDWVCALRCTLSVVDVDGNFLPKLTDPGRSILNVSASRIPLCRIRGRPRR